MRTKFAAIAAAVLWVAGTALGQSSSSTESSLGDLARQQRTRRMKVMQERSVRVWSNDNIPRRPAGEGPTAAAGMTPAPLAPESGAATATAPSTEAASAPATEAAGSAETRDEKYYRKRMGELRARLELHQRQLAVLQQRLSQGRMQFYGDPNKTLQQEFSRSDINKLNEEIGKKQEEIAGDEQAIRDLEDQLRREGHPAGWLR